MEACKLYEASLYVTNIWKYAMVIHTALWILLECGRLMAWALIITLMRRQDVHTDTSVMTKFAELYTSTSYMAWHTDNLSLRVKVELKAGVVHLFRCASITCSFSQNMRMWVNLCLFIRCKRVPFSFMSQISWRFESDLKQLMMGRMESSFITNFLF